MALRRGRKFRTHANSESEGQLGSWQHKALDPVVQHWPVPQLSFGEGIFVWAESHCTKSQAGAVPVQPQTVDLVFAETRDGARERRERKAPIATSLEFIEKKALEKSEWAEKTSDENSSPRGFLTYGKFSEISRSRIFGEVAGSIVFTVFSFYEKFTFIFSARFQPLLTMCTAAAASTNFNAVCAAPRLTLSESYRGSAQ